jgi:hypothetical protein
MQNFVLGRWIFSLLSSLHCRFGWPQLNFFPSLRYGMDAYFCKNDEGKVLQLGLGPKGVSLFRQRQLIDYMEWKSLQNMSFTKKTFVLLLKNADGHILSHKFTFQSKMQTKAVWNMAVQVGHGYPFTSPHLHLTSLLCPLQLHTFFRQKKNRPEQRPKSGQPHTPSSRLASPLPAAGTAVTFSPDAVVVSPTRATTIGSAPPFKATVLTAAAPKPLAPRRHITSVYTDSNDDAGSVGSTPLSNLRTVWLTRGPKGFGLGLIGPAQVSDPLGIFVSSVTPNSPAARCEDLCIGDMLLSVNGVDFAHMTHTEAIGFIVNKCPTGVLQLVLASNPAGFRVYAELSAAAVREADPAAAAAATATQESDKAPTALAVAMAGAAPDSLLPMRQLYGSRAPAPPLLKMRSWATGRTETTKAGTFAEVT